MAGLNNIESKYKEESQNMTIAPPADMWNKIEASLNAKSSKKGVIWYWVIPAAASIALLFILGIQHLTTPSTDEAKLASAVLEDKENAEKKSINQLIETDIYEVKNNILTPIASASKTDLIKSKEEKQTPSHYKRKTEEHVSLIASNLDIPYFKSKSVKIQELKSEVKTKSNWIEKYNVEAYTPSKKKELSNIQIGGSVSPSYNYRQTTNNTQKQLPSHPNSEEGIVTLAAAFDVNMKVNKKWAIESGIRYSRMGQQVHASVYEQSYHMLSPGRDGIQPPQTKKISLANSMGDVNTKIKGSPNQMAVSTMDYNSTIKSMGFDVNEPDTDVELEQRIDYLEIPFTLRYYLPTNREFQISIAAGISTNWLIDNNSYLKADGHEHSMGATSDLSSMTFSSHAGFEISVPLITHLSLKLEPRVNYFLTDINSNHPMGFKPYSFGLFSGFQYSFGK